MAREQTLLDRLGDQATVAGPTVDEDVDALMESVRRHLSRLLNARHGMCQTLSDYGLPSLVDLTAGSGNHVQLVAAALKSAIERYEPRLRRVRVSHDVEDDQHGSGKLFFRVDAILISQNGEHKVWYQTHLAGGGEFDVTG
jgi:type VI secretion system protein